MDPESSPVVSTIFLYSPVAPLGFVSGFVAMVWAPTQPWLSYTRVSGCFAKCSMAHGLRELFTTIDLYSGIVLYHLDSDDQCF